MSYLYKNEICELAGKGHPDKVCDQIADYILDEILKKDRTAHVAVEVMGYYNGLIIAGEVKTTAKLTDKFYKDCAHKIIGDIDHVLWNKIKNNIIIKINQQSDTINKAVSLKGDKIGAGDQGVVYGYACDETSDYIPLANKLAKEILKMLNKLAEDKVDIYGNGSYLKFDSKIMVILKKDWDYRLEHLIISCASTNKNIKYDNNANKYIISEIVKILESYKKDKIVYQTSDFIINNSGSWNKCGFLADTGLTGRKIIADSYGSACIHGGGAFSGKDYTKVDRTGAYFARYIAKNIVGAGLAQEAIVALAYVIGNPEPILFKLTLTNPNEDISAIKKALKELIKFDLSSVVKLLKLDKCQYSKFNNYGHFGDNNAPWENNDLSYHLAKYFKRSL